MDLEKYQEKVDAIVDHYEVVRIDADTKRVHLRDLRWGVEFTYQHSSWLSKLRQKPDGVFWSATRGNVTSVSEGECPFRLEAEQRMAAVGADTFEVVSYNPKSQKAVIRDSVSGVSKEYKFKPFLANLKRGTVSGPGETLKAKSQASIESVAPGRFIVLSAEPSEGGTKVTIEDKVIGRPFTHYLKYIVYLLKKNPDQVFGRSKAEITEVRKSTNRETHGVEFPLQSEKFRDKARKTLLENYGVESPLQSDEISGKFKATHLERYGVEHPMQSPELRQKAIDNSKAKYDGVHHTQHPEVVAKIIATNQDRYGADSPLGSEDVRDRIKGTLCNRYGTDNPQKNEKVRAKTRVTRVKKGLTKVIDGMTMREKAQEIGSAYSFAQRLVLRLGEDKAAPIIDSYTPGGSALTRFTSDLFSSFHPLVDRGLPGTSYRPDLRFKDQKVIVEADGLYWHSDGSTTDTWSPGRNYHRNKLRAYEKAGYRALFFRSDEIYENPDVVRSITLNALGANEHRVFARKCFVREIDPEFFTQTHLMGKGSGRCYGLVYNSKVVAGIQIRWVNKKTRLLDVSRFATAHTTSVLGGWSRLIKHVQCTEQPTSIQTFIDRRYGTGSHLPMQGWVKETEEPSFRWTDGVSSFHRMSFPGNSGYDKGLFKIWDCGQAKWLLKF